jgi:hypothetical protein
MPDTPQSPPAPNWGPTPAAPGGWQPAQNPNWSQPPPAGWSPPGAHSTYLSRPGAYDGLSRLAKLLGLVLAFVGLLVVVVFASNPGNCYQTGNNCGPTGSNFMAQSAWAIVAGKTLFALGLGAIALGALLKLRGLGNPASGKREDLDFVLADRRSNGLTFLVSLLLMVVLLLTVNSLPLLGI